MCKFLWQLCVPCTTVVWQQCEILRLATRWTVRGSNQGVGKLFRTRPDGRTAHPATRTMGTTDYIYGWVLSLPCVKRPGRGVDHLPPNM